MEERHEPSENFTAIGVTSGIGSMLIGARSAGFDVVGNIEWRRYYHVRDGEGRNTFAENFIAPLWKNIESMSPKEIDRAIEIDLAVGHPECGNYSTLSSMNKNIATDRKDPSDLPLFAKMIARLRPRFFAMDNLPRSLAAFTAEDYHRLLPDYDLFFEWVSNYNYGNIQKNRKRFFLIGAHRSEKFVFRPGEFDHATTVGDTIKDLMMAEVGAFFNHDPHVSELIASASLGMPGDPFKKFTWREFAEWVLTKRAGINLPYHAKDGTVKNKPGYARGYWDKHAFVLTGNNPMLHPLTGYPLSIRERARVQGAPDDFVFYGTKKDADGVRWNHEKNAAMIKQTGKFMPVQFCTYLAKQIMAHIRGEPFDATGDRLINPNKHVDAAKAWYCSNVGYEHRDEVCAACWKPTGCPLLPTSTGVPVEVRPDPPAPKPIVGKKASATVKGQGGDPVQLSMFDDPPVDEIIDGEPVVVPVPVPDVGQSSVGVVNLRPGVLPPEYHDHDGWTAKKIIGELIQPDGSWYSRLERNQYYEKNIEKSHVAKTPLHVARWAVQYLSRAGDWVLDPTMGAGTTAVEALRLDRNVAGVEIEHMDIIRANVQRPGNNPFSRDCHLCNTDARKIKSFLDRTDDRFSLIINNPPYSGDFREKKMGPVEDRSEKDFFYDRRFDNLAFMKESTEYWETMAQIYGDCIEFLKPGGYFVIGVKDMMRKKKPVLLHEKFAALLASLNLRYVGLAVLRHHPGTIHLYTYKKRSGGIDPPWYQSIIVFRKEEQK